MDLKKILFPHDKAREVQDLLIADVVNAVENRQSLVIHAPTGLGKTAATMAPALAYAIRNSKTVFFLTSRHTQHVLAIETLRQVRKRHGIEFNAADIIGKRWMCSHPGASSMLSRNFNDYCRALREDDKCEYYSRTRSKSKLSVKAQKVVEDLKQTSPSHSEEICEACIKEELCPYEISTHLAKGARVIVTDYNYIFNPSIRDSFLAKSGKELEDSIIIVDEGHNLCQRAMEMLTEKLSTIGIARAVKEAKKFGYEDLADCLSRINDLLVELSGELDLGDEKLLAKDVFIENVRVLRDYEKLVKELVSAADDVREKQKHSYIGSIASFLEAWLGEDKGYARIISIKRYRDMSCCTLSYSCLDPSIITRDVIERSHSTILMSGTLTPTSMYKDLLGFPGDAVEKEYHSPFPKKNRLNMIVPETTTKFSKRSPEQYRHIAGIAADMVNLIPGNTAVFFPSYKLRDDVKKYLETMCRKTMFVEVPEMKKEEKIGFIERFKEYSKTGAVLLGVASGSFGEGIDLPGDLLKAVIVVGLPLNFPDLETRELIKYYDLKFGRGWDYGYVMPAITKSLQNAGRCIRSGTDKGIVIFLEERYAWPSYIKCFPIDWDMKITRDYAGRIREFFGC